MTSSKDTSIVLRLAACLHILCHYWKQCTDQTDDDEVTIKPSAQVSSDSMHMALAVYNTPSSQAMVRRSFFSPTIDKTRIKRTWKPTRGFATMTTLYRRGKLYIYRLKFTHVPLYWYDYMHPH